MHTSRMEGGLVLKFHRLSISERVLNFTAGESNKITPPDMKSNMEINLVNVALKAGNLKRDIPDPVPGS